MSIWRLLTGRPLRNREAQREEISAPEGLAALSLDALTSVAYGPEAIVVVLATAGAAAVPLIVPVTVAIVVLLALLVLSYTQVIEAYPEGGGAYAVSRANFGPRVARVAAAALIIDYVLTVAVSIAAGAGALTSAFPALLPWTVPICLALLAVLTVLNLRGVGESARAFLLPTVLFVLGILAIIAAGLLHPAHAAAPQAAAPTALPAETLGVLLLLKAFAAGCSALTGVEAIANGVPLFREPRVRRAKWTEALLGLILGAMLLGLALLTARFHIHPVAGQTVLSQVMQDSVGRGWLYYGTSLATTVTLALAANTSFGGLPVLASLLSQDGYLPHVFAVRGDRLVFQYGIWALALLSGLLLVAVAGDTNALIPMFAIGVFTGFTLSQAGLVVHWRRTRPRGWMRRAALNALGALATGLATLVFLATKFTEGAWVVVLAVPLFILLFIRVAAYYRKIRATLGIGEPPPPPSPARTLVVVPVSGLSRLTSAALSDALSFGTDVVAVRVFFEGQDAAGFERDWERWNPGVRLVTLRSQYHSVVRPVLRFVNSVEVRSHERVLVLVPEVVPRHWWQHLLHNQMGLILAAALRGRTDVVVAMLPLHLDT